MCSIENIQRLNKHKTSVSVCCILATVTYKTQMRNYTDIMAKIVVTKQCQSAKNNPNMIAYSFFMTEKIARLLI